MLDDFRNSAASSYEEPQPESTPTQSPPPASGRRTRRKQRLFLGMTAIQRFVLAVMIFFMTGILGTLCLLVTEKIYIP